MSDLRKLDALIILAEITRDITNRKFQESKPMNTEQTNAALARWLGWYEGGGYWRNEAEPGGTGFTTFGQFKFDPMQRIDHAWVLVEHIKTTDWYINFLDWTNSKSSDLFMMPSSEAARAICEAIIELAGIEV